MSLSIDSGTTMKRICEVKKKKNALFSHHALNIIYCVNRILELTACVAKTIVHARYLEMWLKRSVFTDCPFLNLQTKAQICIAHFFIVLLLSVEYR